MCKSLIYPCLQSVFIDSHGNPLSASVQQALQRWGHPDGEYNPSCQEPGGAGHDATIPLQLIDTDRTCWV